MDTGYLNMDSGQLSVKVENSSDKRGLIINIEEYRAKEKDSHKELFPFFVKKCYIERHRYKGNLSFPSKEVNVSICHYMHLHVHQTGNRELRIIRKGKNVHKICTAPRGSHKYTWPTYRHHNNTRIRL